MKRDPPALPIIRGGRSCILASRYWVEYLPSFLPSCLTSLCRLPSLLTRFPTEEPGYSRPGRPPSLSNRDIPPHLTSFRSLKKPLTTQKQVMAAGAPMCPHTPPSALNCSSPPLDRSVRVWPPSGCTCNPLSVAAYCLYRRISLQRQAPALRLACRIVIIAHAGPLPTAPPALCITHTSAHEAASALAACCCRLLLPPQWPPDEAICVHMRLSRSPRQSPHECPCSTR